MRSERAATAATRRSGRTRTWSRYRDNLARHLIGISRDLQTRVRHSLGSRDAARLAALLEPRARGTAT